MFTTLLLTAALSGPTYVLVDENTAENTAENVEIFRRLVNRSIEDAFARKSEGKERITVTAGGTVDGPVTAFFAGNHTVQHSRAFHMPGVGLFLSIDASLPVVVTEQEPPKDERERVENTWERMRREVRGNGAGELGFARLRLDGLDRNQARPEIDPAAIERLIDTTLITVAKYAGNIEALGGQDTVTVALRLSGRQGGWLQNIEGPSYFNGFSFGVEDDDALLEEKEGEEAEDGGPAVVPLGRGHSIAYVLGAGGQARELNLVIRVQLGQVSGAEGDAELLRQRAQINLY